MDVSSARSNRTVISAVEGEYRRYKTLAEKTLEQLSDDELHVRSGEGNSVAIICQHIAGNLKSRFSDFLTSDGEKPWRDRESEFAEQKLTRAQLMAAWEDGWRVLLDSLAGLTDAHVSTNVKIRGVALSVIDALQRSLSHTAYHVGQIVLLGKQFRGSKWQYLTIPPGKSAEYNANPQHEKPPK